MYSNIQSFVLACSMYVVCSTHVLIVGMVGGAEDVFPVVVVVNRS